MVVKLRKADLLILVGMDLDIWIESLIDAAHNPDIRIGRRGYLDVSQQIEKLEIPQGKVDASMGHVHPYGNPHYWLNPDNGKIIAREISDKMSELMPADREYFESNLVAFNQKIDEKVVDWRKILSSANNKKIITYHRSWNYFADKFGIEIVCELEPKPGIPPSPGHLKEVIDRVKHQQVKAIMTEVFYDQKPARFVAEQTGIEVVVVPNSVRGTKEAKDYIALMDIIVNKLANALK